MEQSYGFYWPPNSRPYFITPSGKKIKLKVKRFIPYLTDDPDTEDVAAPSEKKTTSSSSRKREDGNEEDSKTESSTDDKNKENILSDGTQNQIKIAKSIAHLMTHYPKNAHCVACNRSKLRQAPSHPSPQGKQRTCKEFGDHVTADLKTIFKDKKSWGIDGQRCMLVIHDVHTAWTAAYPLIENTTENIVASYLDFMGNQKIKYIYCDGGPELVAAAKFLKIKYDTSTPHTPKRNAIAEEKIKRVVHASRTMLNQASRQLASG